MSNNPRLNNVSKYPASPANNVTVRHLSGKLIRRLNAVLQWNNRRVRAEHRADGDGRFRYHPRLDGYQDNIDLPYSIGIIRSGECAWRKLSITLRTLNAETFRAERVKMRSASNESYIMLAGFD